MESILSYLNNALPGLKDDIKRDTSLIATLLVLVSIPLPYAYSSIIMGLFAVERIITFRKQNIRKTYSLLLPIALFVLMALSIAWSINSSESIRSLSKYLPLVVLPLGFILKPLTKQQLQKLLFYYSTAMVVFAVYYLIRAFIRYFITGNPNVFFYHELVTKDVNAIHVSVYMAVAFFYSLRLRGANLIIMIARVLLGVMILLLSSKNIIVVFLLLILFYFFAYSQFTKSKKWVAIALLTGVAAGSVFFIPKIKERFLIETETAFTENTVNEDIGNADRKVYNVTIAKAWSGTRFTHNEYFPGTAFRVYQARIFFEMLHEDGVALKGYGLNATEPKIQQKAAKYNIYPPYGTYNFHNQYIQLFAELGIAGVLILLLMLGLNLKNALASKDFMHIAFAILMITLFLTESFLSRQRGIIFFTAFYSLFNAARNRIDEKS